MNSSFGCGELGYADSYRAQYQALVKTATNDPLRSLWEALRLAEAEIERLNAYRSHPSHRLIADVARKRAKEHPQQCAIIGLKEIENLEAYAGDATNCSSSGDVHGT